MKLADALASMDYPEDLVVDVAMSRKAGTIELLIAALKELDGETCTITTIGAIVEARRRKDDDALQVALRLFSALRGHKHSQDRPDPRRKWGALDVNSA